MLVCRGKFVVSVGIAFVDLQRIQVLDGSLSVSALGVESPGALHVLLPPLIRIGTTPRQQSERQRNRHYRNVSLPNHFFPPDIENPVELLLTILQILSIT